jgi:hypothetical protein
VLATPGVALLIEGDDALGRRDSLPTAGRGQARAIRRWTRPRCAEAARHNDLQTLQQLGQQAVESSDRELTSGQTGDRTNSPSKREVQLLLQLTPEQAVPMPSGSS